MSDDSDDVPAADADREVDVVVIGLGSGGQKVAAELAEAGLEVLGVDRHLVGGECRYYGCTPTKMMIRAADVVAEARRAGPIAGGAVIAADWSVVAGRVRSDATDDWDDEANVEGLQDAGVDVVHETARLLGEGLVEVGEQRVRARRGVVLATGTNPAAPDIRGLAATPYLTNRDVVGWETLPETMTVIGSGPIGAELAQVFARFGVDVTLLEAADRVHPGAEPEASDVLAEALRQDGVDVRTGVDIREVRYADGVFTITVGDSLLLATPALLVATGRTNQLADVGLDTVGLDANADHLDTDKRGRAAPGVWAVGDITGEGPYTHVALYQAGIVAQDILKRKPKRKASYRAVPRVTFTDPEVASVGLTEAQARDSGVDAAVGTADVATSSRGWVHKVGNEGVVKLVEDRDRGVLVGATVVGPAGGEVIAMLTLAIHAEVPTATLREMIYAFPTWHESVLDALSDLGRRAEDAGDPDEPAG